MLSFSYIYMVWVIIVVNDQNNGFYMFRQIHDLNFFVFRHGKGMVDNVSRMVKVGRKESNGFKFNGTVMGLS